MILDLLQLLALLAVYGIAGTAVALPLMAAWIKWRQR